LYRYFFVRAGSVLCVILNDEIEDDIGMLLYFSNVSTAFLQYFVGYGGVFGLFSEQDCLYFVEILARNTCFLAEVPLTVVKEIEFIIKLNLVLVLACQRRTFLD
jgi:hypothetical protein